MSETDNTKRYFKPAQGFVAGIDWVELHKGDVIAQLDNGERSLCVSITPEEVEEKVASGEWREYASPPNGDLNVLAALVEEWGKNKGILSKSNPKKQFEKLLEEVEETRVAIEANDQAEIEDGIGDCTVVLILLARMCGTDIEHCLRSAYEEIKGRKGVMIDGVFKKFDSSNSKDQ